MRSHIDLSAFEYPDLEKEGLRDTVFQKLGKHLEQKWKVDFAKLGEQAANVALKVADAYTLGTASALVQLPKKKNGTVPPTASAAAPSVPRKGLWQRFWEFFFGGQKAGA
jgi:hypothetical protein